GKPDQSMFTTDTQPIGIQVGTAIATLVKRGQGRVADGKADLFYRDLWGHANAKREQLLDSLDDGRLSEAYQVVTPTPALRYIFTPARTSTAYLKWPKLPDLFREFYTGAKTSRDDLVVDVDQERLMERMARYFNPAMSDEEMRRECPCAMTEGNRFPAAATRARLIKRGFLRSNIVCFSYRPLDDR